ncbi:MAG: YceD family protein [Microbacteriaceae bacterium]
MPASARPYAVSVAALMRRPGDCRELSLEAVEPDGYGNPLIGVRAGTSVRLDVRLESLHEGILASVVAEVVAEGECSRCLDAVRLPVRVEIQELFAYHEDEAFDSLVADESVDLEPIVRDAVVMALPFQPVCRPDCPGLDPETGERLADHPGRAPREALDPRWAALEGFGLEPPAHKTTGDES